MRVSCDKEDPGYAPLLLGSKVFYEGYERVGVFTADEERRLAVVAVLDDKGHFQPNATRDGVLRETIYGHIRIECAPEQLALHQRYGEAIRANLAKPAPQIVSPLLELRQRAAHSEAP